MKSKDLADYEKREKALMALDDSRTHYRLLVENAEEFDECNRKENQECLEGIDIAIELINIDESQYTEGLDDGRDLARNELEPIIKAMLKYIREPEEENLGDFTLEYIEGRLTL